MNPVLRKDLLGLLRLKSVAAIQVIFVAVLAAMVLLTWPQQGMLTHSGGQDNLLLGIVMGQLILLILVVPGVAATSLTSEKENNTLEMLYASRLSPLQIVLGKVFSAIAFPLLLMLSGLPFLGLLYFRGDVDVDQILWSYGILAATAVFLAVGCLAISAVCSQTSTSLVIAYAAVLGACGGTMVPAAIVLDTQSGPIAMALHYTRAVSPVAAALSEIAPNLPGDFTGAEHGNLPSHVVFPPIAAGVTIVCLIVLLAKLRRPPTEPRAAGGGTLEERTLGRRVMYLIDPKKKRKPFGSFNPVIGKESRTSGVRGGQWMVRTFYGMLVVSLGLAAMSIYGGTEHADILRYVFQVLMTFQIGAIAVVGPSLTSASISGEIEGGTFEMLRLSPLSQGKIFWGKFLPAFFPALLPIVALAPAYGAVCFINVGYLEYLKYLSPVIVLSVVFCCTLGLLSSCFTANTARAAVIAYLAAAAFFVLPMLAWAAGAGGMIDARYTGPVWSTAVVSPLVMALNLVPDSTAEIRDRFVEHLYVLSGLCVAMLIAARIRLGVLLRRG
jgi:ABC-type transport system involved in multi-copper enzyme maturation permease subunit